MHQDAAFYSHSNDDVLAVGLLLDDATADNGALTVLPGRRFVGCLRSEDVVRLDRSGADRRLLINSYTAADAISLAPDSTASPLWGRLLRGTWPAVARRTAGDMPISPTSARATSIYELQSDTAARETAAKT